MRFDAPNGQKNEMATAKEKMDQNIQWHK